MTNLMEQDRHKNDETTTPPSDHSTMLSEPGKKAGTLSIYWELLSTFFKIGAFTFG